MTVTTLSGHALDRLAELPEKSVQLCVTSQKPRTYEKIRGTAPTFSAPVPPLTGPIVSRSAAVPQSIPSPFNDRDWLYQKYVVEGLGTSRIAKIVGRDPSRVGDWLKSHGIPMRKRGWRTVVGDKPYHDESWLRDAYLVRRLSTGDIASQCRGTEANVIYFMRRFGIPRRSISEARAVKHWGSEGESNGMYGKRGVEVPNWKGGVTPDRQAFYSSEEWKRAARKARERDHGVCQRCKRPKLSHRDSALHHIVPFSVVERRADIDNLVTLCRPCHLFVHSNKNVDREFIGEGGDT